MDWTRWPGRRVLSAPVAGAARHGCREARPRDPAAVDDPALRGQARADPPPLDESADDQGDERHRQEHDGDRRETVSVRSLSGKTSRLLVHSARPPSSCWSHRFSTRNPGGFKRRRRYHPGPDAHLESRRRPSRSPAGPARERRRWRRTSRAHPLRAVSRRSRGTCPECR